MKVWLKKFYRARALQFVVGVLIVLGVSTSSASNSNNEYYSIVEEHQICDHIIPKFIEQIMNQKTPICGESGVFPKPGNCSVFFKCVQSDTMIQPFVEYCATGYNFVNSVCVPNTNSSDCPQYTCRIPDATHSIGNEVDVNEAVNHNNNNDFQSLPLVVPPSSTLVPVGEQEPIMSSTSTDAPHEEASLPSSSENAMEPMDDSEHSVQMQMTQAEKNSSGGPRPNIVYNNMILSLIILLAFCHAV